MAASGSKILRRLADHGLDGAMPRAARSGSSNARTLAKHAHELAVDVAQRMRATAQDPDLSADGRRRKVAAIAAAAEEKIAAIRRRASDRIVEGAAGLAWSNFATAAKPRADAGNEVVSALLWPALRDTVAKPETREQLIASAREDGDVRTLHALSTMPLTFGGGRELRERARALLLEVCAPELHADYVREQAAVDELREGLEDIALDLSAMAAGRVDLEAAGGPADIAAARRIQQAKTELGIEEPESHDTGDDTHNTHNDTDDGSTPAFGMGRVAAARARQGA